MKTKTTRAFAWGLVVVMLVAMLTGCSPSGEDPTSENPSGSSEGGATTTASQRDSGFDVPTAPITTPSNGETVPTTTPPPVLEPRDPITLTYASWSDREMQEYLVARFEEIYDWIDVELVELDQNSWSTGLFNLASSGDLPDAYCTFYLATSASSGWAKDITEIYNNDPYTQMIPKDMQGAGVYNGVRYGLATEQYPCVVFLNKTLFEEFNIDLPSYDWTVEDMIELAKEFSFPSQHYYGLSNGLTYMRDVFDAVYNTENYQFGFDPETQTFDFTNYAKGYNQAKELLTSQVSPNLSADDMLNIFGNADIWMPKTGHLAMQQDWWWTTGFKDGTYDEFGYEWLIYPYPSNSGRVPTIINLGCVAETTEYPEEAYQLLKFMTFGAEGWQARCDWFKEKGKYPASLPVANDSATWSRVLELTPGEDFAAVYAALSQATPDLKKWIPGWNEFWSWTFSEEIWTNLENNTVKAEDLADQMAAKLKEFYDAEMSLINARKAG